MGDFTSRSTNLNKMINAAFETNDLQLICRAVNIAITRSGGVTEIARDAELDRVTLYRAFGLERGLGLGNMIKVLRVLGLRLIVEVEVPNTRRSNLAGEGNGVVSKRCAATARRFTTALKTGEMESLADVFKAALRAQENVTELAGKTNRTREALYRAFTQNPMPRFSTLLSFLNALGLRFAVRPLGRPKTPLSHVNPSQRPAELLPRTWPARLQSARSSSTRSSRALPS